MEGWGSGFKRTTEPHPENQYETIVIQNEKGYIYQGVDPDRIHLGRKQETV